MGGGSDFQSELQRRQRFREQRMIDKAEVAREKLSDFQERCGAQFSDANLTARRERARMQSLLEMAKASKSANALWK